MQYKYLLLVYLSHGWDSGLLITVFPEKAGGGVGEFKFESTHLVDFPPLRLSLL